jgi:hypothetical protein
MLKHADALVRALLVALAGLPAIATAQRDDVPLPPRIDSSGTAPVLAEPRKPGAPEPPTPIIGNSRPPNAARLAPLPEERDSTPEEIIVIGKGLRLPDLGSAWRARQQAAESEGRFHATLLPLYDPSQPPLQDNEFLLGEESRRQGYIELFRLRFGRRSNR